MTRRRRTATRESALQGPTATALRRIYGRSPWAVFLSRIQELRLQHQIEGPPFDPKSYAEALGVSVDICDELSVDGKLSKSDAGRLRIQLKRQRSVERMRFTLAHEVAHALFYDDLELFDQNADGHRALVPYDDEEERLCDRAAAEMLMPLRRFRHDLTNDAEGTEITAAAVVRVAELYRVSLLAAAIQACRILGGLQCVLWRPEAHDMRVSWATPTSSKSIRLCRTGHCSAETALQIPIGEMATSIDTFYLTNKKAKIVRRTSSIRLKWDQVFSVISPTRRPAAEVVQQA